MLVDDDDILRERLARAFSERGFTVLQADAYDSAVSVLQSNTPDKAVIDLKMSGPSGLELVEHIKRIQPRCEIVILTGYGSIATAIEAIKKGAVSYLQKPADADDILQAFEHKAENPENRTQEFVAPSLARAEWEHINRVLTDCNGNISEAARRLGMHRRSLQRKLQKYPPKS